MEYDEWLILREFIDKLKNLGYLDVCCIFYKMVFDKVFHFVCFARQYGAEKISRKAGKNFTGLSAPRTVGDKSSSIVDSLLNECNFTNTWKKKELEYNELKKDILDRELAQNVVSIDKTDLIEDLKVSLKSDSQSRSNDKEQNEEISTGERREAIKLRTRSQTTDVPRQRSRIADFGRIMNTYSESQNESTGEQSFPQEGTSGTKGNSSSSSSKRRLSFRKESFVNDPVSDDESEVQNSNCEEVGNGSIKDMPGLDVYLRAGDLDCPEFDDSLSSSDDENAFINACGAVFSDNRGHKGDDIVDATSLLLFR